MRARADEHRRELVGEHPRDWTERHADAEGWRAKAAQWAHRAYVGCNYNSPAAMSATRNGVGVSVGPFIGTGAWACR